MPCSMALRSKVSWKNMHTSMTTTNIIIIMMTNVAAVMITSIITITKSMSIITTMMRTAPADATIMTMNTIMITTMMRTAPADAMTITTDTKDIIMQMEVFTSWGKETAHKYTEEELDYLLKALSETDAYGTVLRSKGIIQMADGSWKQFDMVPEEYEVREGQADYTGRVCVIGTDLKEEDLIKLFHI